MFATKNTVIVPEIHGEQSSTPINFGGIPNLELESGTTGAPGHIIQQDGSKFDLQFGRASLSNDLGPTTGGYTKNVIIGTTQYKVHIFTTSGTFITNENLTADILLVAGGGGGGGGYQSPGGGGGGAGGVLYNSTSNHNKDNSSITITQGTYSVTIGDGGLGGIGDGGSITRLATSGGNTSFGTTYVAIGGGRGGAYSNQNAENGGSGGGGSFGSAIGSGTTGQGNSGGTATTDSSQAGAGGGGAREAGQNGAPNNHGGNGGAGIEFDITGEFKMYAAGGGGGAGYDAGPGNRTGGMPGSYTAGYGGKSNEVGDCRGGHAINGSGSGGGGAGGPVGTIDQSEQTGGDGGSGIVIIRYQI